MCASCREVKSLKKISVLLFVLILAASFFGCAPEEASLPTHRLTGEYAEVPEDSGILGAYIKATDLAVNLIIDQQRKALPEFISFNFNTNVPLQPSQTQQLLAAFEVYGIPIDTDGHKAKTVEEMNRGLVVAYQDDSNLNSSSADLTVQVEVITGNYGYIVCSDFQISGGEYILTAYDDSTVVPYTGGW